MRIKLTKIEERSDAEYPNNIPVGDERIGFYEEEPKVGEPFILRKQGFNIFMTSVVTEIIDKNTFKTLNSIYKMEEIKE